MTTATQESTSATQTALGQQLQAFDQEIRADGMPFNPSYMWKTAAELQGQDVSGDAFIVALAIASMTRKPYQGCRTSHTQIARRATSLKKLFALADQVGWQTIMTELGVQVDTIKVPARPKELCL